MYRVLSVPSSLLSFRGYLKALPRGTAIPTTSTPPCKGVTKSPSTRKCQPASSILRSSLGWALQTPGASATLPSGAMRLYGPGLAAARASQVAWPALRQPDLLTEGLESGLLRHLHPSSAQSRLHGPRRPWNRAMSSLVSLPLAQTGEGISECELVKWFVNEGDVVAEFDRLCEVQSDKATIEITSRHSGRVACLHHAPGAIVKVGAALLDIEVQSKLEQATSSASPSATAGRLQPLAPSLQPQLPSAKVAASVASGAAAAAATTASAASVETAAAAAASTLSVPAGSAAGAGAVLATPAVRNLAKELKLDLSSVKASGPGGRVLKEDVLSAVAERRANSRTPELPPPVALQAGSSLAASGGIESESASGSGSVASSSTVVPLRGFRRAMVKSMSIVASIPHFHFCDEVEVDTLLSLRAASAQDPALMGAKLTLLPFAIKALSVALLAHPEVNSSLSASGDGLLLHADHNVGVAMASPGGLVVPNIKHVQRLSVIEIALELQRLHAQALANRLLPSDVKGGTITVSNIGSIGGLFASPLVNPPEAAIVALGRFQKLPRFNTNGDVVARSLLPVSWGADHRVVDGAGLATLSNSWKQLMEEPGRWVLHLR